MSKNDNQQGQAITYTAAHWGLYEISQSMTENMTIGPYRHDPNPSDIGRYLNHPQVEALRVQKPAIRKGWLDQQQGKPSAPRGGDEYIEVSWDTALDYAADALRKVKQQHGNQAIFGGSYGWSSAGRFHHSQSQVHRFLNSFGGYVRSKNSYSLGAASALLHWLVMPMKDLMESHTDWKTMEKHCELFLSFGGSKYQNAQVSTGGTAEHRTRGGLNAMHNAGVRFINVSPVSDDIETGGNVEWLPIKPNTDTALMLALAYTLWKHDLHDRDFIERYCVGYSEFERYVTGETDHQPKDAHWAAAITGLPAERIEQLAFELSSHRSMINMAWSLQRADHGEQPCFALITLAAMLGQIGLPGGGFAFCYGAENLLGSPHKHVFGPTLSQGKNAVEHFIPVARIADMLLHPGEHFTYEGKTYQYQDIRLIYWAGGNPFHHHQDLKRLSQAWQRPETIITNEQYWTPAAKMADIVFPATTTIERNDIFYAKREPIIAAMKQAKLPEGQAWDDYAIFAALSERLGIAEQFTEGKTADEWLEHLYSHWRQALKEQEDFELPDFATFWQNNTADMPHSDDPVIMLEAFRRDPDANPLKTPSGKIEIFSQSIADFGLQDCPGYACWIEPHEWLGSPKAEQFPLHLISDQPKNKLHSQLDHSPHSRKDRINGREPIYLNPQDAERRGIMHGDLVQVFNERGRCLASAVPSETVRQGVVRLSTGAWYDPQHWHNDQGEWLEKHGNPNALTADVPTSSFAQGCTAQTCLVEVQAWKGESLAVTAFDLPSLATETDHHQS
ncbi:molybdopterin-dependent oxidoreductase [Vibrio zhugei]|uniref:Molybdopterin-dependent oxidoreductase n=1 Tax=Vibrio zhugei TaxID=2479546 RepID=A0ABV7C6Q0_9VIBR|nr:molybdopterin-dependent oxidoreductase [Vibrio zhugei]